MLSIIVPTFRQPARLRLTLRNLVGACLREAPDAEIVVVDDDGQDPQVEAAANDAREVAGDGGGALTVKTVLGHRAGRSGARNRGAQASRGARILFLDGDMLVERGTVAEHRRRVDDEAVARGTILRMPWVAAMADPATGELMASVQEGWAQGGEGLRSRKVVLDEEGYPAPSLRRWARANRFERDIHAWFADREHRHGRWMGVTGAHLSLPRALFARLGGFDEAMGKRWGAEDLELGYRLEKAGATIVHLPAVAYHMDHDVKGRDGDHAHALSYFAEKHADARVMRLLAYFEGQCGLGEVAAS